MADACFLAEVSPRTRRLPYRQTLNAALSSENDFALALSGEAVPAASRHGTYGLLSIGYVDNGLRSTLGIREYAESQKGSNKDRLVTL
jgi:hypothetical protein